MHRLYKDHAKGSWINKQVNKNLKCTASAQNICASAACVKAFPIMKTIQVLEVQSRSVCQPSIPPLHPPPHPTSIPPHSPPSLPTNIPPPSPPCSVGSCTERESCMQIWVFPAALVPTISVTPGINKPPFIQPFSTGQLVLSRPRGRMGWRWEWDGGRDNTGFNRCCKLQGRYKWLQTRAADVTSSVLSCYTYICTKVWPVSGATHSVSCPLECACKYS